MLTFEQIIEANRTRQKEWDPASVLTLSFKATELAGEIGEACNVIKKLERERLGLPGSRATVQDLADELADGIICLMLVAIHPTVNIDLEAAIIRKFNASSDKLGLETRL